MTKEGGRNDKRGRRELLVPIYMGTAQEKIITIPNLMRNPDGDISGYLHPEGTRQRNGRDIYGKVLSYQAMVLRFDF